MKTLERMKFTQVEGSLTDSREQLAREAQSVLGYKKLALAIAVPGALLFALRKLEIEPLVARSVEAYKNKKSRPGMWSGHKLGYFWMVVSLILFVGLAPVLGRTANWDRADNLANWGVIVCVIGALASCVCGFILRFYHDARGERIVYKWNRITLSQYNGTVPEFVLSKAIQIKTEVPNANLSVDQLYQEEERNIVPDRDPFLVVNLGDESYYIDVWDEKEYEAKL